MGRPIDLDKAIEIIEEKQKELCPVGRYGRNYVYGSEREKYDAWEEIIDTLDALPTIPRLSNEPLTGWVSVEERLPDVGEICLFYTPCDGFMGIGFYDGRDDYQHKDKWKIITAMRSTKILTKKVTHWMPLPAPPDRRPPERKEDT